MYPEKITNINKEDCVLPKSPSLKVGDFELSDDSSFFLKKILVTNASISTNYDDAVRTLLKGINLIYSNYKGTETSKKTIDVFSRTCKECLASFYAFRKCQKLYDVNSNDDDRESVEEAFVCWEIMSSKLSAVLDIARDVISTLDLETKIYFSDAEEDENEKLEELIADTKEIIEELTEVSFCDMSPLDNFKFQDFNNIFKFQDYRVNVSHPDSEIYFNVPTCIINSVLEEIFSVLGKTTEDISNSFFSKLSINKFSQILRSREFDSTVLGNVLQGEGNIVQIPKFELLEDGTINLRINVPPAFYPLWKNNFESFKEKLLPCSNLLKEVGGYLDVSLCRNDTDEVLISIILPQTKDSSNILYPIVYDDFEEESDDEFDNDILEYDILYEGTFLTTKLLNNEKDVSPILVSFDITELADYDSRCALSKDLVLINKLFPNNNLNRILLTHFSTFADDEVILIFDELLNSNNDIFGTQLHLPRSIMCDRDILEAIDLLSSDVRIKKLVFSWTSLGTAKEEILETINFLHSAINEARVLVPKGSLYLTLEKNYDMSKRFKIFDSSNHVISSGIADLDSLTFYGRCLSPQDRKQVISIFKEVLSKDSCPNLLTFSDPLFSKSFFDILAKKGIDVSDNLKLDWLTKIVKFKDSLSDDSALKTFYRYVRTLIFKKLDLQITKNDTSYFLDLVPGGCELGVRGNKII